MTGVDGIALKFSEKNGNCVVDWLVRIFNLCMDHGEMPEDQQNASIEDKWEWHKFVECTW